MKEDTIGEMYCGEHHMCSFRTVILFALQQISIHIENGPLQGHKKLQPITN